MAGSERHSAGEWGVSAKGRRCGSRGDAPPPVRRGDAPAPSASPRERYDAEVEGGRLRFDRAQARAIDAFEELYERLLSAPSSVRGAGRFFGLLASRPPAPVPGIYLWGGVGRGKTLMMNSFFDALPFPSKLRVHFHAFMHYVHGELEALGRKQDPLGLVADGLSADTRIVCFDEFQVSDIADAMLLGRLLGALFERGVTLVATSNVEAKCLYWEGLQRSRFLPAIELLETRTRILHLEDGVDYRLQALERANTYHWPLGDGAERALTHCFAALSPSEAVEGEVLAVAGRELPTRKVGEGVAWFEFDALCATARSSVDYLEIARRFHSVLIANIPVLDDKRLDDALRFVHLVDVLYERCVNLVVSAAAPAAGLYTGKRIEARFARARSRLKEMQSCAYLSRVHIA